MSELLYPGQLERGAHGTVRSAVAMLEYVRTLSPRILVALSGGKDSLATLDLCVTVFGALNVEAYHMHFVPGLRVELDHLERAVRRYGIALHHVPHDRMPMLLKRGVLGPRPANADRMRSLLPRDVERAVRERTGISFIAQGHREVESLSRLAHMRSCADAPGLQLEFRRCYPIHNWRTSPTLSYLKRKGIPFQVGAGFSPEHAKDHYLLQRDHPEDFARVCALFPYAPAMALRWKMRLARLAREKVVAEGAGPG